MTNDAGWREAMARDLRDLATGIERGEIGAIVIGYSIEGGLSIVHGSAGDDQPEGEPAKLAAKLLEWCEFPHICQGEA